MELVFEKNFTVSPHDADQQGRLTLAAVLQYTQQAAEGHCELLGTDWQTMHEKGLFWAVLRHKIVVERLPRTGQVITVKTWPMPTTRVAYPRAVQAVDENGQELFRVISLWVLMDTETRAMTLPGRCGVEVPGTVLGIEPELPGSLAPGVHTNETLWTVSQEDLDVNCHVNNARYLAHTQSLSEALFAQRTPRQITVCYLSECRLGQQIRIHWSVDETGVLSVDGLRARTDVPEKTERVFAAKICW